MRLKNRFSETTQFIAGAVLAAALILGTLIALTFGTPDVHETTPMPWPGLAVHEDGSVSVDDSPAMQDARAEQWVAHCEHAAFGDGEC